MTDAINFPVKKFRIEKRKQFNENFLRHKSVLCNQRISSMEILFKTTLTPTGVILKDAHSLCLRMLAIQVLWCNKRLPTLLEAPNESSSMYNIPPYRVYTNGYFRNWKFKTKFSRDVLQHFFSNPITFSCILFYIANFGYVLSLKVLFYLLWSLVMYNTVKLVKLKYFRINFNYFQLPTSRLQFSWFPTNH